MLFINHMLQLLTFTVTRPSKSTKKDDIVIGELVLGGVDAHATQSFTQSIKIPPLPPTNHVFQTCDISNYNCLKIHSTAAIRGSLL